MRKLIATEWVSLDGVFDSATFGEWFNPYHSDSRGEYIKSTIDNCEVMLYGRNTYQMLYPYWSSMKNNEMGVAGKLNSVKKYLVTSTLQDAPWENTTIIDQEIKQAIADLKNEEGGDILLQGSGQLLNSLLAAGLVDELKLLVQPHIAVEGRRLFATGNPIGLVLDNFQQLDHGVLVLTYKPVKR